MLKIIMILTVLALVLNAQESKLESSSDCADCHTEIYAQWENSMHKKSTLDQDILYRAMYDWAVQDTEGKLAEKCKNCHNPYLQMKGHNLLSEKDLERPVDCIFCHSIENIEIHPEFSKTKYSSKDNMVSDYHRIEERNHFKDERLCMICHAELSNPEGIPIYITGDEYYNQNESAAKKSCQECHMPFVSGLQSDESNDQTLIRTHTFLGPHNPEFILNSLKLDGKVENGILAITIDNSDLPHAYPTGSPLRLVILKVIGFNKSGKLVFENWKGNPVVEDPGAVFARLFADKKGNAPVPPWQAAEIKMESRLKPGEVRTIKYQLPADVQNIKAKLFFQLAPAPILKRLKIDDPFLNTPHLIDELEMVTGE